MIINKTITLVVLFQACFLNLIISSSIVWAIEDSWITLESMPTARSSFGVAVVDGKIYAVGGNNVTYLNTNEMYDPQTDTWTTKMPMPTPRASFGIAAYQGKIYVFGGGGNIGTTEVYDPKTDAWETKTSLPTPREGLCASVVSDKIYLMGGDTFGHFPVLSAKNEIYDPKTDTWTSGAPVPDYHGVGYLDLVSLVIDNKIYVICDSFTQMYDPETDIWSYRAMIPTPITYYSAGATSGQFAPKRIHVLCASSHQIYDPETDSWTNGTAMPTPRWLLGLAVVNDELYVIGGYNGTTRFTVNEKYTPAEYIPEFPSFTPILVMLVGVATVAVVTRYKLHKQRSKSQVLCKV